MAGMSAIQTAWTPQEDAILQNGVRRRVGDEAIARLLPRRTPGAVKARRLLLRIHADAARVYEKHDPASVKGFLRHARGPGEQRVEAPPAAVAERDRAYAAPPTLEQRLLGDPPPGRSALDRMRAEPDNPQRLRGTHPAWSSRAW